MRDKPIDWSIDRLSRLARHRVPCAMELAGMVTRLRRDNARLRRILRSWLSDCDHLDVNGGSYSRARVVTANDLLAALKDAPPKGGKR